MSEPTLEQLAAVDWSTRARERSIEHVQPGWIVASYDEGDDTPGWLYVFMVLHGMDLPTGRKKTEYRGVDVRTGERIGAANFDNTTVLCWNKPEVRKALRVLAAAALATGGAG